MARKKLSPISTLHYVKLVYRSLLLLAAVAMYLFRSRLPGDSIIPSIKNQVWLMVGVWVVYTIEMLLRFFPAKLESMGCQKQFARNYRPTGRTEPNLTSGRRILAVIAAWLGLNGVIGGLYFLGLIAKDVLVLVSLAYGVCDIICILFFCPFQAWFMKNRCCTVCRIYNWDFAMMFTPLVFIPSFYTWSLVAMSAALLIRWEITVFAHPERFSDATNACVACENCTEKLCHHKRHLKTFIRKNRERFRLK
ncbi:MAG: hypothetical protein E7460_08460 [Ruminococcaceae bacterium]|nr:hypothetical protein [Oscillospiraceae bacterium]